MKQKHVPGITFYAAQCMEFPDHWELHENLTLKQAVAAYRQILKKGISCGPGIGFVLYDERIPDYSRIRWPLYEGRICEAQINLIGAYREHPLVKQAIKEMKAYLPKLEGKAEKTGKRKDIER